MDVKLDNLIEKIKKEAVDEGQQASEDIIKKANERAASIVDAAKVEAEKIIEDARKQTADMETNAQHALQNAARDIGQLLREQISAMFDSVFKREVGGTLTPEFLEKVILKLLDEWAKGSKVEVAVNDADKEKLEALLFSHIKKDLENSVTLRVGRGVSKGFRIEMKGENVYYDFSDDAIADALKAFINPSLQAILDGNDG